MKKKFILPMLLIILLAVLFIPTAKSKTKAYYHGQAINYNGSLIIGSVNMSGFELFKLENNVLKRLAKVLSYRAVYSGFDSFNDLAFSLENGWLFAYLIDGPYLYKYDLSSLANPVLVKQIKDNSWDWFGAISKQDNNIITCGSKDIKIWNMNLEVVDRYNVTAKNLKNIYFSQDKKFIFVIEKDTLKIFDRIARQYISTINFFSREDHNRKIYQDVSSGAIYLVSDQTVEKVNFYGDSLKSFKHISNLGYDVEKSIDGSHLYFSDGLGVVKLTKADLEPVKWAYTTDLGEKGGWAMGLRVLSDSSGEKVVVFNNSSILVLNSNLKLISSYQAAEEDTRPEIKESLFLKADKTHAAANSSVSLHGGGFGVGENLNLTFAKTKLYFKADNQGRFQTILTVPTVVAGGYDIKVSGDVSGLTYSLGFRIE